MPEPTDEDRGLSFEEVHRKYETKIFNLMLRLTGNREDAEDLTVETFVNAYRAWDRFRGDAHVSTWLHQIAVNNCIERFRRNDWRWASAENWSVRQLQVWEDLSSAGGHEELERQLSALERDMGLRPKESLPETERRAGIQAAIAALPPEYRIVLELCENESKSYEEIARILDLTVPTVKTRLHRARARVKRCLEPFH